MKHFLKLAKYWFKFWSACAPPLNRSWLSNQNVEHWKIDQWLQPIIRCQSISSWWWWYHRRYPITVCGDLTLSTAQFTSKEASACTLPSHAPTNAFHPPTGLNRSSGSDIQLSGFMHHELLLQIEITKNKMRNRWTSNNKEKLDTASNACLSDTAAKQNTCAVYFQPRDV